MANHGSRFTDGYDSRYQKAWETAYNSSIVDNNSTYQGNESMLVKHSIFLKPSSYLQTGDTLVIRFRLFSDPYANGWGWGIEDFHLGPLIDNVEDIAFRQPLIYPNPGNGILKIRRAEGSEIKTSRISPFSIPPEHGFLMAYTNAGDIINIDISAYPAGIYFIILNDDRGNQVLKYSLIR